MFFFIKAFYPLLGVSFVQLPVTIFELVLMKEVKRRGRKLKILFVTKVSLLGVSFVQHRTAAFHNFYFEKKRSKKCSFFIQVYKFTIILPGALIQKTSLIKKHVQGCFVLGGGGGGSGFY